MENKKVTKLDGISYELYKSLMEQQDEAVKKGNSDKTTNIIGVLTKVFNDIIQFRVVLIMNFTMGWICPIYKKKDQRDITNYWSITLLNADYKILTKCLAIHLAKVVPNIIYKNQAGFITGWTIFDQVKLSKLMINYTEAMEENGMIIALDQEKAYNRVSHEYLWKTLWQFSIPCHHYNIIQGLYKDTESVVIMNGKFSTSFQITREICQGDLLSFLLFDLAIESLVESLRKSNLKGFQVLRTKEKIIITIFTDDTMVYLFQNDKINNLILILYQ